MNIGSFVEPVLSGITFGLLLAVMIGPVFFTLIQTSLSHGFKSGIFLAIGVFLSDATVIGVCYSFASLLRIIDEHQSAMSWIGGSILIAFGVFNFFHKIEVKSMSNDKSAVHGRFLVKGYFLNIVNPAVFFFWLGVVGLTTAKKDYTHVHEIVFFIITLLTVFSTDLLKSYVANRIKKFLTPKKMLWINRITGIVLVGFGVHMILKHAI